MISKKFFKSSLIYSVIGALPLATSIVLLLFYANLLSTTDLGLLALYIPIAFLVQIIVNFAMDTSIGVHYFDYKDKPGQLKQYVGTVTALLLLVAFFFILLSLLSGTLFFKWLWPQNDIKFYPYGFLSILTGICNSFFKTYTNLLINQERPNRYFWMNVSNFIMTIAFSLTLLFLFPGSLIGPIWGRFLASLVNSVVTFFYFKSEFGVRIRKEFLPDIFSFCLPVFIFILLGWVLSSLDRFIIKALMQATDVAVYDFIVKCVILMEFVQNGLTAAITPKVFNLFKTHNLTESTVEVNRYFNGFTIVNLTLVPLIILAIPVIIPLIVKNPDLYRGFSFVSIIGLGFITRTLYNMYSLPIYYLKKTRVLPIVYAIAAVFQVSFSIIGIRQFGLIGVVYAGFLSKLIQVILLYLGSRRYFTYHVNKIKQFYLPLFYIVMCIISFFLCHENPGILVYSIELVVIYAAVYLVFRKELLQMLEEFKGSRYCPAFLRGNEK